MIKKGDWVVHNDFPPFEGRVIGIQANLNSQSNIAVQSSEGKVIYDYEEFWDIEEATVDEVENGIEGSSGEVPILNVYDTGYIESRYEPTRVVIDVEYSDVDDTDDDEDNSEDEINE